MRHIKLLLTAGLIAATTAGCVEFTGYPTTAYGNGYPAATYNNGYPTAAYNNGYPAVTYSNGLRTRPTQGAGPGLHQQRLRRTTSRARVRTATMIATAFPRSMTAMPTATACPTATSATDVPSNVLAGSRCGSRF